MIRVVIVFLHVSIILFGCTKTDRRVVYSKIVDGKYLITTEYFSLKTPSCFQFQENFQTVNEGNLIGEIACKGLTIHFEYGKLFYSTKKDTLVYDCVMEKEHPRTILKLSKTGYPRKIEVYIEGLEPDGEEYNHIKRSLMMFSEVSDKEEEQLIKEVFRTVKFE